MLVLWNIGPLLKILVPRADQFSMKNWSIVDQDFQLWTKILWKIDPKLKILLKTRANSAKLSAFSDSVTSIYPKNNLKFRAF